METRKCIWMDAGAVEYQLCPLKQNCELCDFHKEMARGCRTHSREGNVSQVNVKAPSESALNFIPGLQYLPGHFWFKRVADGRIRVGIDAFLWQLFSSIHKVVTPEDKTILIQNQCFSWLLLGSGIIYLRTPIPGIIIRTNPIFLEQTLEVPHLHLSPESDLWLIELEVGDLVGFEYLTKDQYLNQTRDDCQRFRNLNSPREQDSQIPIRPGVTEITRNDFSKYLRAISNNQIYVC